ncbi:adhesive domain-containing protein [Carnobacterium gallinarum]|uniref:adhesive domain-containing protein n=1 Tax=Carnobacterium gallinarum TaxID=2749 RepID=UPI00068A985A|nr:adhesive domain-containing protein [Carnobacterium gallinarum]
MVSRSKNEGNQKHHLGKKVLHKAVIITATSALLFSPAAPIFQNGQFLGIQNQTAQAAGLADVSILGNNTLVSNNGTNLSPNAQGNYDIDLTFSGQALASVGLADPKVVVFSLPPELQGKVVGGATINIDANLLPITPGNVPGVHEVIGTIGAAINALDVAAKPLGVNLDALKTAFQSIQNAQTLGAYQESLPGVVSADGKSISVDFTDGFGNYVRKAFAGTFLPLEQAVNQLSFSGLIGLTLNPLLNTLKAALNPVFALVNNIANGSSNVLNEFLSVNLLAGTSYEATFTVSKPDAAQATIHAAAVKSTVIDLALLGDINSEGANVTLNFANPAWDNYLINQPTVNPVHVGDTSISGNVVLTQPIPAGSTFDAIITLADGSQVTAPVNPDGSFSVPLGGKQLAAGNVLSTIIEGTNGGVVKDSTATATTVLAVSNPEWDAYVVAPPVVTPVHVGDTSLTGSVVLTQPIPAGTTFNAIATLPDGSTINGTVGADGAISIPFGSYVPKVGDVISTIVEGTNAGVIKNSVPITTTVTNPAWDNYVVAPPVIAPVYSGDTNVTGTVALTQPIPAGTTFTAIVTLPDGTKVTAPVNGDGSISVPLNGYDLKKGDTLSTIVEATNDGVTKDSVAVSSTVTNNPADWLNYVITTPIIEPLYTDATSINGSIVLTTPIPDGASFTAIATLPDGSQITAPVNGDGSISLPLNGKTLAVGEDVSIVVQGSLDGVTKTSATVHVIVQAVSNPEWTNYIVAAPVMDPIREGDTSLTGKVTLNQPIPVGTVFTAQVALPDGSKVTGLVGPDGSITINLAGKMLTAGQTLSTTVQAKYGLEGKESSAYVSTVLPVLVDPEWTNYVVATPTINPVRVGDTTVTGMVTLNTPIPVGTTFTANITLPDGSIVSAPVNADGMISVDLGGAVLAANDTLTTVIQAKYGTDGKNSPSVSTTVLAKETDPEWTNYVVATPVIDPIYNDATKVTGMVTLAQPIPVGTTFTAVVTLPDGSQVNAVVNPDGAISVDLGGYVLKPGDSVSTVIQAKNGTDGKNSPTVTSTVMAKDTNPEWTNYVVANPVINPAFDGDTAIAGKVTLNQPIPAGSSFVASVTLPNGSVITVDVQNDGTISLADLGGYVLKTGDTFSTIVKGTNNGITKESQTVTTTVQAQPGNTEWEKYIVATPIIAPVHADDTSVTGTVTLNTPIPAGTTFKAIVTLPDGTKVNAVVNPDGAIDVPLNGYVLKAGDTIQTLIEATNNGDMKNSDTISTTILAPTVDPEWTNYIVASPVIDAVYDDATTVTGNVTLTQPIPAGTTFTATVTLPDGSTVNATVNPDGAISVDLGGYVLKAGDTLSTVIQAKNGIETKTSAKVDTTVMAKDGNPDWTNYVVAAPTVDPAHAGDTKITGSVTLTQPIPAGTTFTAIVTLPDGSQLSAPVNPDGSISVDLGGKTIKAGDTLITYVEAMNAGKTKDSGKITTTVLAPDGNPDWDNYVVTAPVVNPIREGDTSITASVILTQPIPADTTFTAIVTLPDGSILTAPVNPDGSITIELNGKTLVAGTMVTTYVEGMNGGTTKDSAKITSTILPKVTTDWDNYVVAAPTVTPIRAGDATITGSVTLAQPIPVGTTFTAIATLPDGSQVSGLVNPDGTISIDLGGKALVANDIVKVYVEGMNAGSTKDSAKIAVTVLPSVWDDYVVTKPTINPVKAGDKEVTGSVTITQPVPAGTTFEAVVTLPDGTKVTGTVAADGTIKVDLGDAVLKEGDTISTIVQATNDGKTKDSDPVVTTIDPAATTDWDNYVVNKPTINPVKVGDKEVTGSVTIAQPVPAGTTFEAVVTLPDGTKVTGTVAADGTIKVDLGDAVLKEGDTISTIVQATNDGKTKDSDPVVTTIDPAATTDWDNYVVTKPTINPVKAGDKEVTGKVELTKPVPSGTTFEAVVTLPDGTKVTGTVAADGTIKVDLGDAVLKEGDTISTIVQATNDGKTKDSDPVVTTIDPAATTDWDNYVVNKPTINPVKVGDKEVTGSVTIAQPVPAGTTFEAVVTLPDGTKVTGTVAADGTIKVDLGDAVLKEGDTISTIVQGMNNGKTKDSDPVVTTIDPAATTDWDNYVVNKPTINPVKAGDKEVTGKVELTKPVPAGTTFEAVVTLPDGTKVTGTVAADGTIKVDLGDAVLKEGDTISTIVQATNDGKTKDSDPVVTTIDPATDSSDWDNYVINKPSVNPVHVGDTEVTGEVELTKPIPDGSGFEVIVTLPGGTTVTGTLNDDGTFTVDLGDTVLKDGDTISTIVQGTNNGKTKDSDPIVTTIEPKVNTEWDNYIINRPSFNPVYVGDTEITGEANLNMPIPTGTTFMANVTLPNGTVLEGDVAVDGSFTVSLESPATASLAQVFAAGMAADVYSLKAGDEITATITGMNAGASKVGPIGSVIVQNDSDGEPGTGGNNGNNGGNTGGTNTGNTGNNSNGTNNGNMQVNYGNGSYSRGDNKNYPQTGEKDYSALELFSGLLVGAAALFLLRKRNKKTTK